MSIWSQCLVEVTWDRYSGFSPTKCIKNTFLHFTDEFIVRQEDLDDPKVAMQLGVNPKNKTKCYAVFTISISLDGMYAARAFQKLHDQMLSYSTAKHRIWLDMYTSIRF